MTEYLRIPVLLPSMGADYSRPATLLNNENSFPQNMSFYRGDIAKRQGTSLFGNAAISGSPVMGYGKMALSTGTKYLVRVSTTGLEKYNELTDVWNSISASAFAGGANDYFDFDMATEDDLLLIVNGVNTVRKWTGSGNNQVLGGSPGIAGSVCYLTPYVILGNLIEDGVAYPWKVKWCGTGTPEVWTGGNSGSQILSDDNSSLLKLKRLSEYAAAYKAESLWLGRKDVSDTVIFERIKTGIGLFGKNCVVDVEGIHYFMGLNDFYAWNGSTPEPIGKNVRDEVFSTVDRTKSAKFFALHVKSQTEVWFYVVITGQTYPTVIWKYNYRLGIWYYDTCSNITAGIDYTDNNGVDRIITGGSSGYSYEIDSTTYDDNSVAVDCSVATKDFVADKFENKKRWLQLDIWAHGSGTLSVDYSVDRGANWTSLSTATLGSTMPTTPITMWFDIVASHIRFRFRNAVSGEYFYLRKFYPYYLEREQSWR